MVTAPYCIKILLHDNTFNFITEWYFFFKWKVSICSENNYLCHYKGRFSILFSFFTREGVKGDFGRKPLIMYAKIQMFQIESKKWLFSDTDNVKTSMYTKNEAVCPILYQEKRILVCKNLILRKSYLKSRITVFFFFLFLFNFETFEIVIYAKVLQNELDSILRFY